MNKVISFCLLGCLALSGCGDHLSKKSSYNVGQEGYGGDEAALMGSWALQKVIVVQKLLVRHYPTVAVLNDAQINDLVSLSKKPKFSSDCDIDDNRLVYIDEYQPGEKALVYCRDNLSRTLQPFYDIASVEQERAWTKMNHDFFKVVGKNLSIEENQKLKIALADEPLFQWRLDAPKPFSLDRINFGNSIHSLLEVIDSCELIRRATVYGKPNFGDAVRKAAKNFVYKDVPEDSEVKLFDHRTRKWEVSIINRPIESSDGQWEALRNRKRMRKFEKFNMGGWLWLHELSNQIGLNDSTYSWVSQIMLGPAFCDSFHERAQSVPYRPYLLELLG